MTTVGGGPPGGARARVRASARPGVTCYGVSVYFVVLKRAARCNNVAEVQCDGITGLE